MRINIVVADVRAEQFSGGTLCLMEHANGLVDRGHDVRVIPAGHAERPRWIDLRAEFVGPDHPPLPRAIGRSLRAYARWRRGRIRQAELSRTYDELAGRFTPHLSYPFKRAGELDRLRRVMPEADVTLASDFNTVPGVHLYGAGARARFMQHYEAYFANDFDEPALAGAVAELGHRLPIHNIANSTWLAGMMRDNHGQDVPVCPNAIDHSIYHPDGSPPPERFTVVSYGGRRVRWKGFEEAAEAIRLARREVPDLHWRVYGGAALPPDNDVAPYEGLGFQQPAQLRSVYSASHATLCPSWYESFPLFPLEAMACGSAVVTTPVGIEDYAADRENALVVPPRDPRAMADALVSLWRDPPLRQRLVEEGKRTARAFTWERASARMDEVLTEIVGGEAASG